MHYTFCKHLQRLLLHILVMISNLRIGQVVAHILVSDKYVVLFCIRKSYIILELVMFF